MENAPQIEIMFEKLIKPSSPTPDHLRFYKLSFLDRVVSRIYAPMVFFYPSKTTADPIETTTRIEQLEKSLSEILSYYYPLAGRIASTDVDTVDCHDQGALFLVKKVRTQMKDLIEKRENDLSIVDCLNTSLDVEGELVDAPLIKVQISVFECGGITVGVNVLLTLADGYSNTKFCVDWANMIHKSKQVRVSFDKSEVFGAQVEEKESEKVDSGPPSTGPVKTKKMKRIMFDGSTIEILKNQVTSSGKWSSDRPPSKVQVVTAVVLSGLIHAAQEKNGRQRPFMTSLSVNLRGIHVPLNLSENIFGSLYIPVPIKFFPSENKMELYDLVCLIRDSLQKTVSECSKASKEDICPMIIKAMNELKEWSGKEDEVDVLYGTSLCRFPLHDIDFGWGKPSLLSMVTLKFPVFALMDTYSGDGVEVYVNHVEPDLERYIAHITNAMHVFMGKSGSVPNFI